ncbi:MAG TPA: Rho termination factor N-terminal domain-containing protein, partial [Mycobacteriales bacterium]
MSDSTDILPVSGQDADRTEPVATKGPGDSVADTAGTAPAASIGTPARSDGSGVPDSPEASETRPRRRGGLSGMVLAELQSLAASLGITGTARMRKNELIAAIRERQQGGDGAAGPASA